MLGVVPGLQIPYAQKSGGALQLYNLPWSVEAGVRRWWWWGVSVATLPVTAHNGVSLFGWPPTGGLFSPVSLVPSYFFHVCTSVDVCVCVEVQVRGLEG